MKNVRNNLFNAKKFVFPSFTSNVQGVVINSPDGYMLWSDLHSIHDQDSKLPANLRKANKLTYRAMHPDNNKQSVNLALSIFHESTIAASKSYFRFSFTYSYMGDNSKFTRSFLLKPTRKCSL